MLGKVVWTKSSVRFVDAEISEVVEFETLPLFIGLDIVAGLSVIGFGIPVLGLWDSSVSLLLIVSGVCEVLVIVSKLATLSGETLEWLDVDLVLLTLSVWSETATWEGVTGG